MTPPESPIRLALAAVIGAGALWGWCWLATLACVALGGSGR